MDCPHCRQPINAAGSFCGRCGARISAAPTAARLVVDFDDPPDRPARAVPAAPVHGLVMSPAPTASPVPVPVSEVDPRFVTTPISRDGRAAEESEAGTPEGLVPGVPPPRVPAARYLGPAVTVSSPGRRLGSHLLDLLLVVVTLGIGWVIWSMVTFGRAQSPAKSLLGLRVVDAATGRARTWGEMFLREVVIKGVLGIASALTLGMVNFVGALMVTGATRQALWDRMAGTVVVDDPHGLTISS